MSVVVVIAQTFLAIYALFRNMNYYDMNAPFLEDFFNAVKGAALKLSTAILGEHAMQVLRKKKGGVRARYSECQGVRCRNPSPLFTASMWALYIMDLIPI